MDFYIISKENVLYWIWIISKPKARKQGWGGGGVYAWIISKSHDKKTSIPGGEVYNFGPKTILPSPFFR
jgi:hypothetical protein